tara:strand:+ start:663 stop:944 length:282 start_codon:yes stop_codon:yes gene_type:complete
MKTLVSVLLIFLAFQIQAHPGRIASDGCHYCRTNCEQWGVPKDQRHCHNGRVNEFGNHQPLADHDHDAEHDDVDHQHDQTELVETTSNNGPAS